MTQGGMGSQEVLPWMNRGHPSGDIPGVGWRSLPWLEARGQEQRDLLDILPLEEGALPAPVMPHHVPWGTQGIPPSCKGHLQVDVPRCTE